VVFSVNFVTSRHIDNLVCRVLTGRNTADTIQWTDRLEGSWSRWICRCLQSKAWTIWHCCLQGTQYTDTQWSVCTVEWNVHVNNL